jgi:nitroimidazol reductase NimA-like FMN-containing flavoprotein (pyridoxamine 5'-phosphate oxidase superfamily)
MKMKFPVKGAWSENEVRGFLEGCGHPIRLAVMDAEGYPRVVSLWFRFEQGKVLCVTHRDSYLANCLRSSDRVGFEVSPNEPPYMGVRGYGEASLEPLGQEATLAQLLHHYLGGTESSLAAWLLSRSDEELLVTLTPKSLFSWDYRERMADTNL